MNLKEQRTLHLSHHASVSSAELVRHFGQWQDHAASGPVVVTHHGRGRVVMLSAAHYRDLVGGRPAHPRAAGDAGASVDLLMEHVAQGFVAFDHDMTITAINRAACCFLKVERDLLIGHRLDRQLPGIEETLGYASLSRAARSGCVTSFEMPSFAYADRWLLVQTFPHGDGAACLFRDITDDLEARRQGDARTATLAALAVHGAAGRAQLTPRGTFSDIDATFAGIAGFTPEGLARARLTDILVRSCRTMAADAIEAVLEGGEPRRIDARLLNKAGSERDVRIGLAPLRGQGGATGAIVVMTECPATGSAAIG